MMDEEKRKLLKESLEIMQKYSNEDDAGMISSLLADFDSNALDESTLNQFVHDYYSSKKEIKDPEMKKTYERSAR